jgi:hypothetical protein
MTSSRGSDDRNATNQGVALGSDPPGIWPGIGWQRMTDWPPTDDPAIYVPPDGTDTRSSDATDAQSTAQRGEAPSGLTEEQIERQSDAVFEQMGELAALGIELLGSSLKPTGEIEVKYMAGDQHAVEQVFRERFGWIVRPRWEGASRAHTFTAFAFGSWLSEEDRLTVFYGLPLNGQRPGGCLAFETEQAVIVSLQILSPRGYRTLLGGFTAPHATVRLKRPLGQRVVIDDSANRARPHWTRA